MGIDLLGSFEVFFFAGCVFGGKNSWALVADKDADEPSFA